MLIFDQKILEVANGDILFIKISPKITLAETYLRISLEQPLETHGEVKSFE